MTLENKKILGYFGLAVGLGLVGAMVYYALSNKSLNIDKTSVKLGEDEEDEEETIIDETTPVSTNNYSQLFANLPKFNSNIEFQFKPLGVGILK
jgi:glutamate synthase domain-containing protein 3